MSSRNVLSTWINKASQESEEWIWCKDQNKNDKNDEDQNNDQNRQKSPENNGNKNANYMKEFTNYQQIQLDVLNKTKFTTPFTGNPKDTIPYLFAVDMHFKVCMKHNI